MITRKPTWDSGKAAIDEIERIVAGEDIECEFTRVPAFCMFARVEFPKKEASSLKKEGDVAAKLGFDADLLESVPYFNLPGGALCESGQVSSEEISSNFA